MKKFEMHSHCFPVSRCSKLNATDLVDKYHKCGFDGLVLTNHYSYTYIEKTGATMQEFVDAFLQNYYDVKAEAEKYGMVALLGAEVTLYCHHDKRYREMFDSETLAKNYADYLLVGVTEEFIKKGLPLFDYTLPQLKKTCEENGILLFQAHPFRYEQKHSLKDVRYLDGIELNGCSLYDIAEKRTLDIAREHNLLVIAGGDTHYTYHKLQTCVFLPDYVKDSVQLRDYVKEVGILPYSLNERDDFADPVPPEKLAKLEENRRLMKQQMQSEKNLY